MNIHIIMEESAFAAFRIQRCILTWYSARYMPRENERRALRQVPEYLYDFISLSDEIGRTDCCKEVTELWDLKQG